MAPQTSSPGTMGRGSGSWNSFSFRISHFRGKWLLELLPRHLGGAPGSHFSLKWMILKEICSLELLPRPLGGASDSHFSLKWEILKESGSLELLPRPLGGAPGSHVSLKMKDSKGKWLSGAPLPPQGSSSQEWTSWPNANPIGLHQVLRPLTNHKPTSQTNLKRDQPATNHGPHIRNKSIIS